MKKISLVGAGGHVRSIIGLLINNNYVIERIFDDGFVSEEVILGIPLLGTTQDIQLDQKIVLAIGDGQVRERYFNLFNNQILTDSVVHPTAWVEAHVKMGVSNNVFAKVFINNGVEIGNNNLINSGAIIEHEVNIGSHNHISISAILLGRSRIGDRCFIAAGAIIKENVKICSNVVIGANSFVSEDIVSPGTYVGSPARRVK